MAVINHSKREINAKIVYFGPPGSGKKTIFHYLHQRIKPALCGPLKTMASAQDTLLFFDYIPFETSSVDGYRIRLHLYTLTGSVNNPGTWKMLLKGVDAVALVVAQDNQVEAVAALRNLRGILAGYGREIRTVPRLLLQPADVQQLDMGDDLTDVFGEQLTTSISLASGDGLVASLASLSQGILQNLKREFEPCSTATTTDGLPDAACLPAEQPAPETSTIPSVVLGGPSLSITVGNNSVYELPLTVESESCRKRYILTVSMQLKEIS